MIRSLEASVEALQNGGLRFSYSLSGDMGHILIPPASPPCACDGLWQHTCFEAFLATPTSPAYREFNFSPSGQWAAYPFIDYRHADTREAAAPTGPTPRITVRTADHRLELEAILMPEALPKNSTPSLLYIGLCAVIESLDDAGTRLSYWALRHPGERPDFHDRRGFALRLTQPNPVHCK